jgi:uncharacterized integral membrane protein
MRAKVCLSSVVLTLILLVYTGTGSAIEGATQPISRWGWQLAFPSALAIGGIALVGVLLLRHRLRHR